MILEKNNNEKCNELSRRKIISSWAKPRRSPNDEERKKIIGLVVKILVSKCLKNHCYQTGGKIFQQKKNGLIGPDIQRALCHNYVMRWNEKFIELCKEITENSNNDAIDIRIITENTVLTFLNNRKINKPEKIKEEINDRSN